MPRITLYTYWRSSSSYRVRIALAIKGLKYESVAVNLLAGEQASPAHVERSPTGFIPYVVIDGKGCAESVAIVELIDELFPTPPLFPRDPWEKARVRALVEIVNAGTQPVQNTSVLKHLSQDKIVRDDWCRHFISKGLTAFERSMEANAALGASGRYAYGDTITAADVFLVPQAYNARRYGIDLAKFPRVAAAVDAALREETFLAALPENQPDAMPGAP